MVQQVTPGAVVVGVDGSACSEEALAWGVDEATRRSLPLHLVHATNIDYLAAAAMLNPLDLVTTDDLVEGITERLRAEHPGLAVAGSSTTGSPVHDLVAYSADADTVVVGAHGKGGVRGALGSVSLQVAMHAASPVVVVRGEAGLARGPVVVGFDGSALSLDALGYAFEQAASRHAPLVVLHAWKIEFIDGVVVTSPDSPQWKALHERLHTMLEHAVAGWREKYPEVEVELRVVHAPPAQALAEASEGASLAVVGARGRGGFAGLLLGSVSQGVLHRTHCPVAIVRGR